MTEKRPLAIGERINILGETRRMIERANWERNSTKNERNRSSGPRSPASGILFAENIDKGRSHQKKYRNLRRESTRPAKIGMLKK